MNIDVINIVVTGLTGLIGAGIGSATTYKATKVSIDNQNKMQELEKKEKQEFAFEIIKTFLSLEIEENFKKLRYLEEYLDKDLRFLSKYQIGLTNDLIFKEFEAVKYDLLKYSDELTRSVIYAYNVFKVIDTRTYVSDLKKYEFELIKSIYNNKEKLLNQINNQV
ncbi:hypothetical protein [Bacillus sp. UNCCL81]|uniref:hypothetical protein n=1 Tax=Bacillus sp. UNCCL81 TaxID=1502755 RepID=UPI0008EF0A0B|nr:hypothetical protein [Bacillus sp. UNCCL81]SFD44336.1 hypothetical protein SAMN02799633_03835 [Bacillus sp. UNCCL81]